MNALEHILGAQDKGVKQRSHRAKNHAEDQVKPQGVDRRVGQFTHLNDRALAIKNAKDDARHNDAGKHRFNRDQVVAELRAHLFDNEQNARQRRVKRGGKPRRRAGCQQRMARFGASHPKQIAHHAADVPPQLYRGPFPAKHHARAQGPHAADEFNRDHPPPAHRTQLLQRTFNFRDARPARLRREFTHQKIPHHGKQRRQPECPNPDQPFAIGETGYGAHSPVEYGINRFFKRHANQTRESPHHGSGQQDRQRRFIAIEQPPNTDPVLSARKLLFFKRRRI